MTEPVPPNVNEGQLRLLLDEQHESEILDYKRELNLVDDAGKTRVLVEIAKDVAAMASGRGGHLVIGADDRGQPTGLVTPEHAKQLDEARLRPRLERYVPDGLEIRSAAHEIDGSLLVLLHVAPHSDGLIVMKADGMYADGENQAVVFRAGDIFIRRGTESRRLGQTELRRRLDLVRRNVEVETRADVLKSVAQTTEQGRQAEAIAAGTADSLSWDLDTETLVSVLTEQARRGDDIPLQLLMAGVPARSAEIMVADENVTPDDLPEAQEDAQVALQGLLERIVAIGARNLVIHRDEVVVGAINALRQIYDSAFDERGFPRRDFIFDPAQLWLMVIERVYALGALAVRMQKWTAVRTLAAHAPAAADRGYFRAWLRHGHVMAARAGLLQDSESRRVGASLLKLALNHIVVEQELRPDLDPDDEGLLSSLCQFDMLANLSVASENENQVEGSLIYPHFRRFYSHRSDPAVVAVLEDTNARQSIFPGTDEELALVLRQLGRIGSDEFFFVSGWDGFEDTRIQRFLEEHPDG